MITDLLDVLRILGEDVLILEFDSVDVELN
jgi:hypothetical protein